jgi:hypothetical protein
MIEYEQLHLYAPVTSDEILEALFTQALRTLVKQEPKPQVEARFYPYTGLSSTIRLRGGKIYARVSDILISSPRDVLYALACILVSKLYRLKAPKLHERTYREHTLHPSVLDATNTTRRSRGYKVTTTSRGETYDLAEMFKELNQRYFSGKLEPPLLSWSTGKTRRVLGHHDHVHGAIIISRTLDRDSIPRFVVEYVLYHEMLHVKHPPRVVSGRTIYHGRPFREDERRFEKFKEALEALKRIATPKRGRSRRRRGPRR